MNKKLQLVHLLVASPIVLGGCAEIVEVERAHDDSGKELVCHKGKKTLSVSSAAVAAHLDHGDRLGSCGR
jgi:hypothetical protein